MSSEQPNSYRPHSPERQPDRFFIPTEHGEIPVNHLNEVAPTYEEQQSDIAAHTAQATEVAQSSLPEAAATPEQLIGSIIAIDYEVEHNRNGALAA